MSTEDTIARFQAIGPASMIVCTTADCSENGVEKVCLTAWLTDREIVCGGCRQLIDVTTARNL